MSLYVDGEIIAASPPGTCILSIRPHGRSRFFVTAKIDTHDVTGYRKAFFVKAEYITGPRADQQAQSEYLGLTKLYEIMPSFVPRPLHVGNIVQRDRPTCFMITDFKHFNGELPHPNQLGVRLADLHRQSLSYNRLFGFEIDAFVGVTVQDQRWERSWTTYFARLLSNVYEEDRRIHGHRPVLYTLMERTLEHLVPRLVGIMEMDGRSVPSCLIHGDLWDGNVGTEVTSGNPWIFDCAVYYAHAEMDLASWRPPHHRLSDPRYRAAYWRHMEPTEPKEEREDRNLLYSVIPNLFHSVNVPGSEIWQLYVRSRLEMSCLTTTDGLVLRVCQDLRCLLDRYVPQHSGSCEEAAGLQPEFSS